MPSLTAQVAVLLAASYGPEVSTLAWERGAVIAVVGGGLYLQSDGGSIACLVDASRPDGPLTLRLFGLESVLRERRIEVGDAFTGGGFAIEIGGKVLVNLDAARPWTPPFVSLEADRASLQSAIAALRGAIASQRICDGLAPLVTGPPADLAGDPLLRRASEQLDTLSRAWRQRDAKAAAHAARGLLGLGPGLTPSGDDLLCGLLAVSRWAAQPREPADAMSSALTPAVLTEAPSRTTRLSTRLLAHAARGLLYEPAMSLGAALFTARHDLIRPSALRLLQIGHTTGSDMAVGLLLGAELML